VTVVFETERLRIRTTEPTEADAAFFFELWTNPDVMRNVGFPHGLRVTLDDVRTMLAGKRDSVFDAKLLVELEDSGATIGECKLGTPDSDRIAETDVKLLPVYWGNGYGREIKQALVDYLFTHTDARAISASPNKGNIASQKMQEAVGGEKVGEGVYRFPDDMREFTEDVPYIEYRLTRDTWLQRQKDLESVPRR